jgi:maleate isomerase
MINENRGRDALAWRCKFGVVTPSTNTIVQPEYDDMRFPGVTNHLGRMHIPDDPVKSDADFNELIRRIDVGLDSAIERVLTAKPDHLILGISAESIWGGGLAAARNISDRIKRLAPGLPFTQASDALPAALKAYGVTGKVGVLTPYFPVAEKHIRQFISEIGFEVAGTRHLSCPGPVAIAYTTQAELRKAIEELHEMGSDAIIQFGANLPMGRFAAIAEAWLDKPVIAVNTATYWHALRSEGIKDQKPGYGRLIAEF